MNYDKYATNIFKFFLLAIAPTIIMGFFKISTYTNVLIWIWDVLMIMLLAINCILKKYKIYKKDFIYIILFILVIIFQILDYSSAISLGTISKLYTILPIVYFTHFICSFVLIGGQKKTFEFNKFFKYFTFFVVFCCFYNIIINLKNFSRVLSFDNKYLGFSSFFNHRNSFGQLLFLGTVSNILLLSDIESNKRKKYYYSLILILVNLLLTFSRTSILSTLVFFSAYFLQNMFSKKDKKSTLIALFVIVFTIVILFIGINNERIMNFINYYIFRSEDGLSGRDTIWKIALSNIKGSKIITGYGIGTTAKLFENYGLTNSHNSIIEIVFTGGIIFLLFYICVFTSILNNILNFENKIYKKIYLSFLISFFVYIMFEKILLFSTGYAPIIFTIFLVIIPKLMKKRDVKNEKRFN